MRTDPRKKKKKKKKKSKNQVDAFSIVEFAGAGTNKNLSIINAKINNATANTTLGKTVNVTGDVVNVKLINVDIEGVSPKGIYCDATGTDISIKDCTVKDATDAIYVNNVVGVLVKDNKIKNAYNGVMLSSNANEIICKDNKIGATVKISDTSTTTTKIIADNMYVAP